MGTVRYFNVEHPRKPYKTTLEMTIPSHPGKGTLVAISRDISDIGICVYTFKPLEEGQEVIFKTTLPVPHRKATVRWIKQIKENIYRAGILLSA